MNNGGSALQDMSGNGAAEEPNNSACDCGKAVDPFFLQKQLPEASKKCRFCKVLQLLTQGIKTDKYSHGPAWIKRKQKVIWLSEDYQDLFYRPKNRKSPSCIVTVPLSEALGVVYGAYTSTFKQLKDSAMPPHWAAFSLVSRYRTYDFSARSAEAVEACVMGLQHIIYERRQDKHASSSRMTALEPWTLGFFLWMRLRFRLQEEAVKANTDPTRMLWIVFMRCAFACPEENSKRRFIGMAKRLERDLKGSKKVEDLDISTKESRYMRVLCQKNRAENIIKGVWYCMIEQYIPYTAKARALRAPRHSGTHQLPALEDLLELQSGKK